MNVSTYFVDGFKTMRFRRYTLSNVVKNNLDSDPYNGRTFVFEPKVQFPLP